jgi:hypothetical protein
MSRDHNATKFSITIIENKKLKNPFLQMKEALFPYLVFHPQTLRGRISECYSLKFHFVSGFG